MLDIDAIRARAGSVSGGPWHCGMGDRVWNDDGNEYVPVRFDEAREFAVALIPVPIYGDNGYSDSVETAEFIAHARTDVPALCDEVERLRQDPERLVAECCAAGHYDLRVRYWPDHDIPWTAELVYGQAFPAYEGQAFRLAWGHTRHAAVARLWQAIQDQGAPPWPK